MRKWIFSRSLILALIATTFFFVHAETETQTFLPERHKLCQGFAPPNDLWIPDAPAVTWQARPGVSRAQFNEILDRIQAEYSKEVQRAGGIFKIERKWSDGNVNAYAYRDDKKHWIISMFGGMARHPVMTYDGFVSVACHELGHHFGGLPKFRGDEWAAVEGEADYYAMLKCMRRVFAKDDNKTILAEREIDPAIKSQCEAEHRGQQDQLLCIRIAQAGLNIGNVLAQVGKDPMPHVLTPDPKIVKVTFEDHPQAQCRLDTYVAGSLCLGDVNVAMSDKDAYVGACPMKTVGARPRCWFKP